MGVTENQLFWNVLEISEDSEKRMKISAKQTHLDLIPVWVP